MKIKILAILVALLFLSCEDPVLRLSVEDCSYTEFRQTIKVYVNSLETIILNEEYNEISEYNCNYWSSGVYQENHEHYIVTGEDYLIYDEFTLTCDNG